METPGGDGPRANKHQLKTERTRLAILDAAEPLFAPDGLSGVSMRQIAAAAGVDLSLASYHFDSKASLYNAVIDRIMVEFTDRRMRLLDELEARSLAPSALELFDTLISAWFEIRFGPAPHRLRLILHGHHPRTEVVEQRPSDPFAKRFLAALMRAAPQQPPAHVHWSYHSWTGAMVYFMTSGDRVQRLSGDWCDVNSPAAMREALLDLVRHAFPT